MICFMIQEVVAGSIIQPSWTPKQRPPCQTRKPSELVHYFSARHAAHYWTCQEIQTRSPVTDAQDVNLPLVSTQPPVTDPRLITSPSLSLRKPKHKNILTSRGLPVIAAAEKSTRAIERGGWIEGEGQGSDRTFHSSSLYTWMNSDAFGSLPL
jgi:hypothetical protein